MGPVGGPFERYYLEDATKNQNIKDGVASTFTGRPVPIEAVDCVTPICAPNLLCNPTTWQVFKAGYALLGLLVVPMTTRAVSGRILRRNLER